MTPAEIIAHGYDKYPSSQSTKITGIGIPISHNNIPRPIFASMSSWIVNGQTRALFQPWGPHGQEVTR